MTHFAPGTARLVPFALAVASLSVSGCSPGCALGCGGSGAYVMVPNSTVDQIELIETEPPCVAQSAREDSSEGEVYVTSDKAGTCQVRVHLTNGDAYAFSVEFALRDGDCCGELVVATGASVPVLVSVDRTCSSVNPGVAACGGDVVGTWSVTPSCLKLTGYVDMAGFGIGCTSAPVTWSLQVAGTWTAFPDGMYSDNTKMWGDETIELPASCLNLSGTAATCQQMGDILQTFGYGVNCTSAASGGCTCLAAIQKTGGAGSVSDFPPARGKYTTSGNVLTTEDGTQYPYCVSGNTMTWTPQSTSPTTTGTIVFQKQ